MAKFSLSTWECYTRTEEKCGLLNFSTRGLAVVVKTNSSTRGCATCGEFVFTTPAKPLVGNLFFPVRDFATHREKSRPQFSSVRVQLISYRSDVEEMFPIKTKVCEHSDECILSHNYWYHIVFYWLLLYYMFLLMIASVKFLSQILSLLFECYRLIFTMHLVSFYILFSLGMYYKLRPSILVLELEMSVLRIINLLFYPISSQQIGQPKVQLKK